MYIYINILISKKIIEQLFYLNHTYVYMYMNVKEILEMSARRSICHGVIYLCTCQIGTSF